MAISEGAGMLGAAGINLGMGIYNNYQTAKAREAASRAIDAWNNQASKLLDQYEAGQRSFSSAGDMEKYQQLKNSYNPNDYIYNFDKFDNSKYDVENYVNENKDKILADVGKGVQATAAGAALGHSSGALDASINAQMDKSEELYNNAYNRMNSERSFDYQQYQNYIQNMQNKLNLQQQGVVNQMNMLQGDLQLDQQQAQDNMNNRLSLGNSITQSKASLV